MSYYRYHIFFCTNQRPSGEDCCARHHSQEMRDYAKQRVKQLDKAVVGNVRINSAGCLNRCEQGPVMVVYPEAVWYTWVDKEDIDEIIDKHLGQGQIVERLRLHDD
jgi:(2Fe-2S) ferredoxin